MIKPGIYKHFKGGKYKVHFVAKNSENLEEFVVYEALYENKDGKYWIRPAKMFDDEKMNDGKLVKRFQYISEN
ncbi:MAG: DUF1653 domain-containing protein [Patescibacteria group bacterium]